MASNIYGELIKAQLQNSAADLTPVSTGLIYFNTSTGVKWYTGSVWKTAVDLDSSQTLSFKTLSGANVLTNLDLIDNASIRLFEANTNGSNKIIFRAPVNLAADYALILPTAQAQANQFLKNDGVGNLSWAPASGGAGRNYLSDWNDASRSIGTVETVLTSTGNRTSSQTSWGASAIAGLTISNNSTTPLRETGDFLIDSSTTTIGAFVESPMFNLDLVDLSKAVVLSFDITGNAADGNYDVVVVRYNSSGTYQETISVAGNASSGTPASAKLPTGTTTFKGFFVSSNTQTDFYSVRIRKTAAVNDDFQIDSIFVGPQSLATGAIVTDWQSYTPTLRNSTNTTITQSLWRRVGDSMEILIRIGWSGLGAGGVFTVSMPSGYTIDTSKQNSNTVSSNFGYGFVFANTGPTRNSLGISYNDSTSFRFYRTSGASFTYAGTDFTTSDILAFTATVPISQWTSNVTTAERAVEEYVFSTATTTTAGSSDTTSFGYGAQGVQFRAINSTTTNSVTAYRCRFQTPIVATSRIDLESSRDQINWIPLGGDAVVMRLGVQGLSNYGMSLTRVSGSTTDVDVYFGNNGRISTNAAYAGNGADWAGIAAGSYYWRLRKTDGGAAVGFPVSARNLVGDTSGTAVPAGYIGEVISGTVISTENSTTSPVQDTYYDVASPHTITLGAGVWRIVASIGQLYADGTGTGNRMTAAAIRTSTNTVITEKISQVFSGPPVYAASGVHLEEVVSIATSTTYKISYRFRSFTGTLTVGSMGIFPSATSKLFAIRIG